MKKIINLCLNPHSPEEEVFVVELLKDMTEDELEEEIQKVVRDFEDFWDYFDLLDKLEELGIIKRIEAEWYYVIC